MSFVKAAMSTTVVMGILLTGCGPKYAEFGEPMKLGDSTTISVAKVLSDKDAYDGKYIRVSGKVASVCAKKGCWLRMTDGSSDETVFVKFTCPVDGRLVPMDAVGHDVVVEGKLAIETVSEADARHYAEDAGKSTDEIAKIVGDRKQLRMAAPAARVLGMPK